MGLTLAYEGMMLLGAMVATIIVGVITASDLSGVQWDGIISLISVFVAFDFCCSCATVTSSPANSGLVASIATRTGSPISLATSANMAAGACSLSGR